VLVENREGAEQGARHLIEHGHKKIACVGFDSGSYTVRERIEGYNLAMRSAGLQPILFANVNNLEAMQALALRWSTARDRPTAAFSPKRISSLYLIPALHLHKLKMPEDIAVVGFDDFELAEVLGAPLTVVRRSPTGMARAAAERFVQENRQSAGENRRGRANGKDALSHPVDYSPVMRLPGENNRCHLGGEHISGAGRFIFL
jgi:LacI family transcriptional regulator